MPRTLAYAQADTLPPRAAWWYVVPMGLLCLSLVGYFAWNAYVAATFDGTPYGLGLQYKGDFAEMTACALFFPMLLLPVVVARSTLGRCLPSTRLLAVGLALGVCAMGITLLSHVLDQFSTRPPSRLTFGLTVARLGALLSLAVAALIGAAYHARRLEHWHRIKPGTL